MGKVPPVLMTPVIKMERYSNLTNRVDQEIWITQLSCELVVGQHHELIQSKKFQHNGPWVNNQKLLHLWL